jgi:hypothetical protein
MSWKPGQVYASDLRRKTATLVKAAERLGDPFLQNLYLIALAHLNDRVQTNRQAKGWKPKPAGDSPEGKRAAAQLVAAKARE